MKFAFVARAPLPSLRVQTQQTCPRMSSGVQAVVDENYPLYVRNRAPFISFDGEKGVRIENKVVPQFALVDRMTEPLFDYSDPLEFKPQKPVPPSAISWPSGDGRGMRIRGTKGSFNQPNLKEYGPFPDFFKRSCDG